MPTITRRRRWPARSLRVGMWFFAIFTVLSIAAWCVSVRWRVYTTGQFGSYFGVHAGSVSIMWPSDAKRRQLAPSPGWHRN
ncbi:MAG: hypothetical protein KF745_12325 [Phycisphaeraceae bacterium]|nr:hypothetical protein [Phycisphaeraceae bacterium]